MVLLSVVCLIVYVCVLCRCVCNCTYVHAYVYACLHCGQMPSCMDMEHVINTYTKGKEESLFDSLLTI